MEQTRKQAKPAQWRELKKQPGHQIMLRPIQYFWMRIDTFNTDTHIHTHTHTCTQDQVCATHCFHSSLESFCVRWCFLGQDSRLRGCIKKYWYDEKSKCLSGSRDFRGFLFCFSSIQAKVCGGWVSVTSQNIPNQKLGGLWPPASLLCWWETSARLRHSSGQSVRYLKEIWVFWSEERLHFQL